MNIQKVTTVIVSLVILGGCTLGQTAEVVPSEGLGPTKAEMMSYDLGQVSEHNKAEDCWLVIDDKVYDVTRFIEGQKHPGGAAILEGCGKEATELFNTRPMGSKTPHSDKARAGLENFYIGDLKK